MPEVISVYRNDTLPDMLVDIVDYDPITGSETPSDLSADGIIAHFKTVPKEGGTIKVNSTLTAIDASIGQYKYSWATLDNDTAVVYKAEISLEYPPVAIVDLGAWSNLTAYVAGDMVTNLGLKWRAIAPNTGVTPVEGANWTAYIPKTRTILQFELNVWEDVQ